MPNYLCNDVENGGKNVEQLVRIERSSLTNIWRALCADCIPVEILLSTFIGQQKLCRQVNKESLDALD